MADESKQASGERSGQRFTVTFSNRTYKLLWAMERELNVSMADVLRESIVLMWRVFSHLKDGNRVVLRAEDGDTDLALPQLEQARSGGRRSTAWGSWISPEGRFLIRWMVPVSIISYLFGVTMATIFRSSWLVDVGWALPVAAILLAAIGPLPFLSVWIGRLVRKFPTLT